MNLKDGAFVASLHKPQHVFQDTSPDVHLTSMFINTLGLFRQAEASYSITS